MGYFLTAPYLFAALRFSGKDLLLLRFLPDHFSSATEQHGLSDERAVSGWTRIRCSLVAGPLPNARGFRMMKCFMTWIIRENI